MTFGRGMMNGASNKQKINTTSSTEAEVVGVHDNMPAVLWTPVDIDKILMPAASKKQENIDDDSNNHSINRHKKSVESQECVGRVSDKNNIGC